MSISDNKRITVLMLLQSVPPLPAGGAEIQALRLSKELIAQGITVIFITPGVGRVKGRDQWEGIPVYRLHSMLNYFLDLMFIIKKKTKMRVTKIDYNDATEKTDVITTPVGFGARLRYVVFLMNAIRFMRKQGNDVDIIHAHTIEWPAYVGALLSRKFKKKLVVKDSTMNGIQSILRYPSGVQKRDLIISKAHFVAMTRAIKSNFLSIGIPAQNISLIPNGIKLDKLVRNTAVASHYKVLFVGNLYQQPAKGVDILLKAWRLVQEKCPGANLNIAGDGDLEVYNAFALQLGISDTVHFLGKQSDIVSLLMESTLFVLPSRREGMPNALMEAMLRGVPAIATDISGCQDLISNNVNGLLVPPVNDELLAEAIMFMLEHPAEANRMGAAARKTICDLYSIEATADKYISLYNKLLL